MLNKCRYSKFLIVIIVLILNSNIFGYDKLKYAEHLSNDGDYFRAISIYKEIYFNSLNEKEEDLKNLCLFYISKSYYKSNKYKASIQFLSRLINSSSISEYQKMMVSLYFSLNYYNLKIYQTAEYFLKDYMNDRNYGYAMFYDALLKAEQGKWDNASTYYLNLSRDFKDKPIGIISLELYNYSLDHTNIKTKSPRKATLLSSVIPGAGQFYSKHYYDSVLSFLYVTLMGFATYAIYQYDDKINKNYTNTAIAIPIFTIFYLGNLIGAHKTTEYYNFKQKYNFIQPIREKTLSFLEEIKYEK